MERREFLKLLVGSIAAYFGRDLLKLQETDLIRSEYAIPDLYDGKWHTVSLWRKGGKIGAQIDGYIFEEDDTPELVDQISEPLNHIKVGKKNLGVMIREDELIFRTEFHGSRPDLDRSYDNIVVLKDNEPPEVWTTDPNIAIRTDFSNYG